VKRQCQVSGGAATDRVSRIGSSNGMGVRLPDPMRGRLIVAIGKTPWAGQLPSPRAFYGSEPHPPSAMLPFGIFAEARIRPWRLSSPLSTDGFFGVAKR
jgi:hypothetical protein